LRVHHTYAVGIETSGNFIVTEKGANMLARVTTAGVRTPIFDFASVCAGVTPEGVAIDSNGDFIVGETACSKALSRITPAGVRSLIHTFTTGLPGHIIRDPGTGNFVTTSPPDSQLIEITPGGTRSRLFTHPGGSNPQGVARIE
jgi:hypothetical protein